MQFVAGQLNDFVGELGQSTRSLLGFATAILEYARGPTADLGTVDRYKIGQ